MFGLTKEEKLKFIIAESKNLGITSYEYGQNTEISDLGARHILTGESKNPRTKNLNIMLEYLISRQKELGLYTKVTQPSLIEEPSSKFIPIITEDKVVPYYNIEINSSTVYSFEDAAKFIEFYIDYKPLNDCSGYLPYFGNSMAPLFKSGDTVAIKKIENLNIILWGEPHLVVTKENANKYKIFKLVFQHKDDDKIILRSANPEYPGDIVIHKKDISSLFIVKGKIELTV